MPEQNTSDAVDLPASVEDLRTAVADARSQQHCGNQFPILVETEAQLLEEFSDPRFCQPGNPMPAGSDPEADIPESDL